jgi:hypothetical protein
VSDAMVVCANVCGEDGGRGVSESDEEDVSWGAGRAEAKALQAMAQEKPLVVLGGVCVRGVRGGDGWCVS